METKALRKADGEKRPSVFYDLFKPWNEWFDETGFFGKTMNMPAVNITEEKGEYKIELAVPGMKKDDFKIDVDGNMLTISSETEESTEEKEKKFTRREYSYASFSRSFTLPEEVNQDMIEAKYEDGVLKLHLPTKEDVKKVSSKKIAVN